MVGVEVYIYVGQFGLDQLEGVDCFVELFVFVYVWYYYVYCSGYQVQWFIGEYYVFEVQVGYQYFDVIVNCFQYIGFGYFVVFEYQFIGVGIVYVEFVQFLCGGEVFYVFFDQECGDVFGIGGQVGFGIDYQNVGIGVVGDLYFVVVEYVVVVVFVGVQFY